MVRADEVEIPADKIRDSKGKILAGSTLNPAGLSTLAPHHRMWRREWADAISAPVFREVLAAMIKAATSGDMIAAMHIIDRCLGRAVQGHLIVTDDATDATRDPVSMIRELRAALGVHDEQPGQPGQPASVTAGGAEIVDAVEVDAGGPRAVDAVDAVDADADADVLVIP